MAIHKNTSGRGLHQPGQYQVVNETASQIEKGKVVQIVGLNNFLSVEIVNNPVSNQVLGVVVDDIYPGDQGYVARIGLFGSFDTSGWTENVVLYSDSNGDMTTIAAGPALGVVRSVNPTNGHIQFDVRETSGGGGGSGGHAVITTTLTQTDINNEFINLPVVPVLPNATIVMLEGAPSQIYGDDYTVSSNTLTFITTNPGSLGNILTAGDKLTIMYQ